MLEDSFQPTLHPTTSLNFNKCDDSHQVASPPITLPPPASSQGFRTHQRARTAIDLPPLFKRTPASSPTRSSTFLPFLKPTSLRSNSPERVSAKEAAEFEVGTTPPEETPPSSKSSNRVDKFANWFSGASDPINISLVPAPTRDIPDPVADPVEMERIFSGSSDSTDSFTRRPVQRPSLYTNPTQSSSRFSFFRKAAEVPRPPEDSQQDELAQLDITTALFPAGRPDEFSPSAFKNLQMNAEGTLRRLQEAYKQNLQALGSIQSQKNIQADELEAAITRSDHLKLQLTEMAERAMDQDRTIVTLREERSRKPLAAGEDRISQSIRMVSEDSSDPSTPKRPDWRRSRVSDTSTLNGFESGSDMSSAASVFSEAQSIGDSPGTSIAASPVHKHAFLSRLQPLSLDVTPVRVLDCQKCHGIKHSEAWDVIAIMKEEKQALQKRIEELEGAADDALDYLNGLKLST